ncbi:arginine--tRNA ligase, partial [Acinetobacter baumannii]
LGNELGNFITQQHTNLFSGFNLIKGFLNLTVSDNYWQEFISTNSHQSNFGIQKNKGERVMVEYSSPNTNKPLHLGHLRNN